MTLSSTFATFLVEEEKLPTFLIETPSEMLSNTFMNLHLLAGLFPSLVSWESSLELFEAMVLGERNNTIGLCYMSEESVVCIPAAALKQIESTYFAIDGGRGVFPCSGEADINGEGDLIRTGDVATVPEEKEE